jgi:hypothetical protein
VAETFRPRGTRPDTCVYINQSINQSITECQYRFDNNA